MKDSMRSEASSVIRTLLVSLSLAGCSDPDTSTPTQYRIGGTVTGLTSAGLVLEAPGLPDLSVPPGQTTFVFQGGLKTGSGYVVDVKSQPSGPAQTCFLAHGTGTVASADVTDVTVWCKPGGSLTATGSLQEARLVDAVPERLPSGRVLLAGGLTGLNADTAIASAEIFDPSTGQWSAAPPLMGPRADTCSAVLLNGKVLVTGGDDEVHSFDTAEVYDEGSNTWTPTATPMTRKRFGATCTRLPSGKVLVAGGGGGTSFGGDPLDMATAELYDPATNSFTATGSMATGRWWHRATLLDSGKVLVVAGCTDHPCTATTATAELYDPITGTWAAAGQLPAGVTAFGMAQISVPVAGGGSARRVLVAGGCRSYSSGCTGGGPVSTATLFDPSTATWSPTGSLPSPRSDTKNLIVLSSGDVLLVNGGYFSGATGTARYDAKEGVWAVGPATLVDHSAVWDGVIQLADGRWLLVGGAYRGEQGQLYRKEAEIFSE